MSTRLTRSARKRKNTASSNSSTSTGISDNPDNYLNDEAFKLLVNKTKPKSKRKIHKIDEDKENIPILTKPKSPQKSPLKMVQNLWAKISPSKKSPFKNISITPPDVKVNKAMRRLNLDSTTTKNVHKSILTTPPKRTCFDQVGLIKDLSIKTDKFFKKDVMSEGSNKANCSILNTTLSSDHRQIYTEIKSVLTITSNMSLVGRKSENLAIENFIKNAEKDNNDNVKINKFPHSMYISGAPGTGKTFSILNKARNKNISIINVMSNGSSIVEFYTSIFAAIMPKLKIPKSIKLLQAKIEKFLQINGHILVLDEIDSMANDNTRVGVKRSTSSLSIASNASSKSNISTCSVKQSNQQIALCWLFTLASKSKLILISIANTLDFTQRSIPELYELLDEKHRPVLLNFKPYNMADLVMIVNDRLKQTKNNKYKILQNSIISFTCMKISSQFGDIRRVLDILKRAVEYVESNAALKSNGDIVGVSMRDINLIINSTTSSVQTYFNNKQDSDSTLPVQQAIFLCSVFKTIKKFKTREISFTEIQSSYLQCCESAKVAPCHNSDLLTIVENLSDLSFITVKNKTKNLSNAGMKKCKIGLNVQESEVKRAFEDKVLFNRLL